MNRKIERHGKFVAQLGNRLLSRYTDGGPGLNHSSAPERPVALGRGGRFARQVQRSRKRRGGAA